MQERGRVMQTPISRGKERTEIPKGRAIQEPAAGNTREMGAIFVDSRHKDNGRRCVCGPPRRNASIKSGRGRQVRGSRVKHQAGGNAWLHSISISLLVSLLAVQKDLNCLRISSIGIPPAILNGSQTTLECNYELGPGDQLYSVTWYKDRVTFYRYQPPPAAVVDASWQEPGQTSPEPSQGIPNSNYQQSPQPTAATNAEFNWAGINLDLAKSNATHVHLKQVGPKSEGAYECEVIADAPTFATVSASRQMKVYALPKRKLTLTDNLQQAGHAMLGQDGDSLPPANPFRQNLYQLNDLLNLTCVSGASKPAARLSWFLNDLPVGAFLQPANNSGLHKAQAQQHSPPQANQTSATTTTTTMPSKSNTEQLLTETRSNLLLRLQPAHLRQLRNRASQQQRSSVSSNAYLPLKLSCVSQLMVEFSSNTSLLISGGKTSASTMKRSRAPAEKSPEASSWRFDQPSTLTPSSNSRRRFQATDSSSREATTDDYATERDATERTLDAPEASSSSVFKWPPTLPRFSSSSSSSPSDPGLEFSSGNPSPEITSYGSGQEDLEPSRKSARNLVVWTNRQLRDQADFIERLLARSNANGFEPAHIEAQTVMSYERRVGGSVGTNGDDEAAPLKDFFLESGQPVVESRRGLQNSDNRHEGGDFELHELVNFTCHQTDRSGGRSGANGDDGPELHSVQLRWFLNDQELSGGLVNAYEQTRGFHFDVNESRIGRPQQQQWAAAEGRLTGGGAPLSSSQQRVEWTPAETSVGETSRPQTRGERVTSRSLLVEFGPSLFRLKELNLRCKTIVEQPLIEYESVQWLQLATSPFIQAQNQAYRPSAPRPTLFNVNSRQRPQQQQHRPGQQQHQLGFGRKPHRNEGNVVRARHQPSKASSSGAASSTTFSSQLLTSLVATCLVGLVSAGQLVELIRAWPA